MHLVTSFLRAVLSIRPHPHRPDDCALDTKPLIPGELLEHRGQLAGVFQRGAFDGFSIRLHFVRLLVVYAHIIVRDAHRVKGKFTKKLTLLTFDDILADAGGELNAGTSKADKAVSRP